MSQHAGLAPERWAGFDLDEQILMIGNEMNRATRFVDRGDTETVRRGYERVLRLVDLTVAPRLRPSMRRELLRWREVVAGLYIADSVQPDQHRGAFRVLLQLTPVSARQIPHLLPRTHPPPKHSTTTGD